MTVTYLVETKLTRGHSKLCLQFTVKCALQNLFLFVISFGILIYYSHMAYTKEILWLFVITKGFWLLSVDWGQNIDANILLKLLRCILIAIGNDILEPTFTCNRAFRLLYSNFGSFFVANDIVLGALVIPSKSCSSLILSIVVTIILVFLIGIGLIGIVVQYGTLALRWNYRLHCFLHQIYFY